LHTPREVLPLLAAKEGKGRSAAVETNQVNEVKRNQLRQMELSTMKQNMGEISPLHFASVEMTITNK
jgi:hypothetical protein